MKALPSLISSIPVFLTGCVHRWVPLLDNETTRYFLEAQYDCRKRTFMTLWVQGSTEHRLLPTPKVIEGNVPVSVVPGSREEERLQAPCEIVGAGVGA